MLVVLLLLLLPIMHDILGHSEKRVRVSTQKKKHKNNKYTEVSDAFEYFLLVLCMFSGLSWVMRTLINVCDDGCVRKCC